MLSRTNTQCGSWEIQEVTVRQEKGLLHKSGSRRGRGQRRGAGWKEEGGMHRGREELHVLGREDPMSISAEYKGFSDTE